MAISNEHQVRYGNDNGLAHAYADTQVRADFLSNREYQHGLLLVKLAEGAGIQTVWKQIFTVPKSLKR